MRRPRPRPYARIRARPASLPRGRPSHPDDEGHHEPSPYHRAMDLAFAPAVELLAKLRARDVSARELTELYLGRIERLNPQLNAVVTLDAEGALARANELDRKREPGGRLHGLPITIKDQFETAGLRTTCGAELYKD